MSITWLHNEPQVYGKGSRPTVAVTKIIIVYYVKKRPASEPFTLFVPQDNRLFYCVGSLFKFS